LVDTNKKIKIIKKSDTANDKLKEKSENLNMEISEITNNETKSSSEDFAKMFEESLLEERNELRRDQIITGKIVEIRNDYVFVDVNYKSEGIIPRSEFETEPELGQEIEVFVLIKENEDGELILSKTKADSIKTKEALESSYFGKTTIKGKVEKEIKGGFIVNVGGENEAFVPISEIDIGRNIKPEDYIGNTYEFKITKYEKKQKQSNIVLSRRALLEEELKTRKEKFLTSIKVNDLVEGTVKNILDKSMFVSLGDIDGFVHIKDLSWGHIKHPSDLFKVGDKVKAKVLEVNGDKISLGIKQLSDDPWSMFTKEYKKNDTIKGEVLRLTDFGAFIKVFEGVEGMVHISEMSWVKRISHPKEILKKGDIIETKILEIDDKNKKLSLGLKQVLPNPWNNIHEILPVGKKVKGKVKSIIKSGIFVELEEGIEGFLPQKEIDWIDKEIDMKKEFKKNDEIEVVILQTNKKEQKILLGRKQLIENPYHTFINQHRKGDFVTGVVKRIEEFGAFVELDKDIEGLIPKSHISHKKFEKIEEIIKIGDTVNCVILDSNLRDNKISLSMKNYEKKQERMEIEKFSKDPDSEKKSTLGDYIDFSKFKKEE